MAIDNGIGSSKRSAPRPTTPSKPDGVTQARPQTTTARLASRERAVADGFEKARPRPPPPVALPEDKPVPPSATAEEAKALIDKHKNALGLNLDEKGLGKELAELAVADPAKNGEVIQEVFNQLGVSFLGGDNREQVARELVKNLSDEQVKQLAGTEEGREVLETVKTQLERNGVSRSEQAQVDRINDALYPKPASLEEIKAGLEQGRTDDNFRDGVAEYFGGLSADEAHQAMESIRADGLQRQLIDSVVRDNQGNPADPRLREGLDAMLNTGRLDFYVTQLASKSYNVFDGEANGTTNPHYLPSGDENQGVYIPVGLANNPAELPRTLTHETFHAFARDNGSTYGAAEEGMGIAIIHYAFTDGTYNAAEAIYGTMNWYRDSGDHIDMGGFGNANPLLQDVLGQVSSRDVSEAAWDDPEQLQSDYDDFWSGSHRFEPPGEWGNRVQAMTDAMVYEHKRERLEALGLTPDQIISAIGPPPELPEPNVK